MSHPTKTADRSFSYDQKFGKMKLQDISQEAHKRLSQASKWFYRPLVPGQFGYDNMIMSVGVALTEHPKDQEPTEESIASLIHDGWCRNYLYWRDHKPWLLQKYYKAPAKPLGDKRRDACAFTSFEELDQEEQEKDLIIARYLLELNLL